MTAKHCPATIWPTRIGTDKPYQIVRTDSVHYLMLSFFPGDGADGASIKITRSDARLLARRIMQCLEATR